MLETIEKLLILQDRDRKISRVQQELAHITPERETLRGRAAAWSRRFDWEALRLAVCAGQNGTCRSRRRLHAAAC